MTTVEANGVTLGVEHFGGAKAAERRARVIGLEETDHR